MELDAEVSVQARPDGLDMTFHAWSGERNRHYAKAVSVCLRRLGLLRATLRAVAVVSDNPKIPSGADRKLKLPEFGLPLRLEDLTDVEPLRVAIGREVAAEGRPPGAPSGGNPAKKIRLLCTAPEGGWPTPGDPVEFLRAGRLRGGSLSLSLEPYGPGSQLDAPLVVRLAASINAAASGYEVGQLQALRVQLRGLKRLPGRSIFSDRSTQDEWAFHSGGRDELQFNIGLDRMSDGREAVRAGVGFSLEQSRTLPDWRVLAPLIARLNEILREQGDAFADLAMWEWSDGVRGPDRVVGPIDPAVVRSGVFIFLGDRQPSDAVDVHRCLRTFDRLLPVYREVLADWPRDQSEMLALELAAAGDPVATSPETLDLNGGVASKKAGWSTATYVERTLDIELRHNELQNRLKAKLEADGVGEVMLEARLGQRAIDLVVRTGAELWFYEVKTGASVRQCLREAIGQLLEYALWPGATLPTKLVVVGEGAATADSEAYLAALNARFPVRLAYEQFTLD